MSVKISLTPIVSFDQTCKISNRSSSPRVAFVVPPRRVAHRRHCTACRPAASCRCRADACCRRRAACRRAAPCHCCAARHRRRAASLCRPAPLFFRVVAPLFAVVVLPVALLPIAVVVPPVAVLPRAVVVLPIVLSPVAVSVPCVAIAVPRRRTTRCRRCAAHRPADPYHCCVTHCHCRAARCRSAPCRRAAHHRRRAALSCHPLVASSCRVMYIQ